MTEFPKKIYVSPVLVEFLREPSSEEDQLYFLGAGIPDSETISEIARNFTTEGENSDLIYRCYREGMLKMKSIILNSSL